jgi:hypothetical protein
MIDRRQATSYQEERSGGGAPLESDAMTPVKDDPTRLVRARRRLVGEG